MLLRCHTTSAQALYRVFVSPSASSQQPLYACQATSRVLQHWSASYGQRRILSKYRKVAAEETSSILKNPTHPVNEDIPSAIVHLSKDGKFHTNQTLRSLISEVKALNEKLKQDGTTPRGALTYVRQHGVHADGNPIVKFVTEKELWEQAKSQKAKQKTSEERPKQLELNWALDQQDLQYRLARLHDFLSEGRRVEVLLANKKGARRVTREDMETLLDQLRTSAKEVPGAEEFKPMEGAIGGKVMLFFGVDDNTRAQLLKNKKEAAANTEDKRSKKERDREERKAKELERQRRAEERAKELESQRTVKIEDL